MREISVSIEVFAQIWASRRPGEQDENAVLERIFREHQEHLCEPKPLYNHDDEERETDMSVALLETGISANPTQQVCDAISSSVDLSAHARWWEVVYAAIEHLGGEAQLHHIYKEVEQICTRLGKRMPKELEATVRGTLEDNCAESHRYKHVRDVFTMTKGRGQGTWGIRQR